jgi:zinc protease
MTGTELVARLAPLEHRLPNGLTLLVQADHSAPVVAIVTHVRAGYFDEPDHLVGVSHVLEHMYFKGTSRRGVGQIARATKAAGGYLNAGTIYDRTTYYTALPAGALDLGLDIQADALLHSAIDEEELRRELTVIVEEVKRKLDNPSAMATEKLYEAMFDRHPIRRWRMGTPEALAAFSRQQVVDYYRGMYRAGNVVLVVSGAVAPDRVVRRVEELYGGLEPGGSERPPRPEPETRGARFREMSGDIAHTYAELGWRTPGTLHADTPALDALSILLGQGRASRLYQAVRERGLAFSVAAHNYTPTEIGVLNVSLECEPWRTADALRGAWREVRRLCDGGGQGPELDRVRTVMQVRLLRRLETAEGRANLLAAWQAVGHWSHAASYLDRVAGLEPRHLRDVAARYLDPELTTLLVYRPAASPAIGWTNADLPAVLEESAPAGAARTVGDAAGRTAPARDAWSPPAAVMTAPAFEDGVAQHPLAGGRIVVKPRPHAPLVSLALVHRGGTARESAATAGLTGLTVRAALKGTTSRSAERIAIESEAMGGSISVGAGADLVSWSLTVPSGRFEAGLELLADVALNPAFPDAGVETERELALAALDRVRDDMFAYPLRLLLKAGFGGHPYGLGLEETRRALEACAAGDVRRWHREALGEPWLFVVGDVEADRVVDTAASLLAGTPSRPPGDAAPPATWTEAPSREEVRRERAQTALAIGFPGPGYPHPDRWVLDVAANAISGLGNRLFEELRSRRSLAYSVTAYPLVRRHGGAFVGYIATSPERAVEARDALLRELVRLRTEPLAADELERAREYSVGAWQIRTQTNAAQLAELAAALMLGEGLSDIREFEARTRAVDGDQVIAAADRWFHEERVAEGVVRGGAPSAGD